jgi:DNA-binding GntR family transcriptional regulator
MPMTKPDPMKRKEQSTVASQRVVDIVAERILSGHLKPGEHIKQDELAAELNMSRIPVRDALRMLETRGLVALRANAGARVTTITARDMEIAYRVREQLEPMLLAESMAQLTDDDIEEMRAVLAELVAAEDVEDFLPLDRRFHWIAYRRHNAPQLAQMVERLWDTTQSYRRAYAKLALKNGAKIQRTELELLFGAIERREIEMAQATLLMHIRRTRVGLVNYGYLLEAEPVVRTSTF